ncbi:MAG: M20 family metallopeptidase [Saprospiraceae bacterium]
MSDSFRPSWYIEKAKQYLPDTILLRRHLHQHPELSFVENKTAAFIEETLNAYNIDTTRIGHTGVLALLEGSEDSEKVIALRADIDALPIHESHDRTYHSQNKGVMHACGHDVHTASLLTTARILAETKNNWSGKIKIIFQPAEEKFPGGASILINEGVLENPKPGTILAQHVSPELTVGQIGFKAGPFMASADELYITVRGKGGHGAMPHTTRDTILIASHMVVALQQIVSRNNNPLIPSVLTLGKINSDGGATNIIPGEVCIEGTFRTFDETWRKEAKILIRNICEGIAQSMGGSVELDIKNGYPVLLNDADITSRMKDWAIDLLGKQNVIDLPMRTTAEDFAYYSQLIPACFYRLGTAIPGKEGEKKIHTPDFDIDENAFITGVAFMTYACHRLLAN